MLTSCLIPQSIDAIDSDAGSAHPPPRIEVENMPPFLLTPTLIFFRQGPADAPQCSCQLQFSTATAPIVVQEDDPFIDLEARWFVDYDPTVRASIVNRAINGLMPKATDFVNAPLERNVPEFDFDALGQSVTTSGIHIVELVVADQQGFATGNNLARPNRTLKPGYTSSEYRFVVNVNLAPDPNVPNCPNTPPSARVNCSP